MREQMIDAYAADMDVSRQAVAERMLIDMLTFENADDAQHRRRLNELADYRNYFRFNIDICDPDQGYRRISDLEQRRGKASGGQKFVPFYICLGVAAASASFNHLGGSREAPPQSALQIGTTTCRERGGTSC